MIGKFDCRVFCHINSLGDKISNTAATIQPNPFGFGKNLIKTVFPQIYTSNFCISAQEGPRECNDTANCSQWPHLYTTYEATYDLK